jgi:hypothetical protein
MGNGTTHGGYIRPNQQPQPNKSDPSTWNKNPIGWTPAQPGSPQYEHVQQARLEGRQPYQMGRSPPPAIPTPTHQRPQLPQPIGIGYKVIRHAPTKLPPHPNYGIGRLPPQQHQGGGYARPQPRQTPNKTVSNPYFSLGGKRPIKFL